MDGQAELVRFASQATAASWPFFVIVNIIFAMRCVARLWFTKSPLGWDDIVISLSWAFDIVRMTSWQLGLTGVGNLDPSDPAKTYPNAIFWVLFTDTWAFLSITLPKIGVSILLVRIFEPRRWVRNTIMSMSLGLFVYCIGGFIISFVQCNPVAGQWDAWRYPNAKCWARNVQINYALVGSSFSAFLDLAYAIYPGVIIWTLQMPTWQKLSTMGLMGLGLVSFAFGLVKVTNNATLLGTPTVN